jgi:hypothetical protein
MSGNLYIPKLFAKLHENSAISKRMRNEKRFLQRKIKWKTQDYARPNLRESTLPQPMTAPSWKASQLQLINKTYPVNDRQVDLVLF